MRALQESCEDHIINEAVGNSDATVKQLRPKPKSNTIKEMFFFSGSTKFKFKQNILFIYPARVLWCSKLISTSYSGVAILWGHLLRVIELGNLMLFHKIKCSLQINASIKLEQSFFVALLNRVWKRIFAPFVLKAGKSWGYSTNLENELLLHFILFPIFLFSFQVVKSFGNKLVIKMTRISGNGPLVFHAENTYNHIFSFFEAMATTVLSHWNEGRI